MSIRKLYCWWPPALLMAVALFSEPAHAQRQVWHIQIIDSVTRAPLPGAVVADTVHQEARIAPPSGWLSWPLPPHQPLRLQISCVGYQTRWIAVHAAADDTLRITLASLAQQIGEVMISATRIPQPIQDIPQHVQLVDADDIEEGTAMSPGNIRELLTELSGTQIQQTSAVSGYAGIRLLGLGTEYTQLLKDGFPLYGGLSGSLSMLQIPPLDLQRVEVIKGASSTLYGGDAIAGVINLVSKEPGFRPVWTTVLNQTLKKGTDAGTYFSMRGPHLGTTIMGTYSRQQAVDVNDDGFSDLPFLRQFTIQPGLYWYGSDSSKLWTVFHVFHENRVGGDMQAIAHGSDSLHAFLQRSLTSRVDQEAACRRRVGNSWLTAKLSWVHYQRQLNAFKGNQFSVYSEVNDQINLGAHRLIAGMNWLVDDYHPESSAGAPPAYHYHTWGLFGQDDWKLSRRLTLELGLRQDWHSRYGAFFLPAAAVLWNLLPALQVRVGRGEGYKVPSLFNAQSEEVGYTRISPLSSTITAARSYSWNADIFYHHTWNNGLVCSVDQAVYRMRLEHALISTQDSLSGALSFTSAPAPIVSTVSETNIHLRFRRLEGYWGYTWVHALRKYDAAHPRLPLTPASRLVSTYLYEVPGAFKCGLEAFYTGRQYLDQGTRTRSFWTFDIMVEKIIGPVNILLNVENITDTRQSRWGPIFSGSVSHPQFAEIYAPLDGRVINLSLKWNLLSSRQDDVD
jgi:outer membrane receptor for ferrienterochelin and colicins